MIFTFKLVRRHFLVHISECVKRICSKFVPLVIFSFFHDGNTGCNIENYRCIRSCAMVAIAYINMNVSQMIQISILQNHIIPNWGITEGSFSNSHHWRDCSMLTNVSCFYVICLQVIWNFNSRTENDKSQ